MFTKEWFTSHLGLADGWPIEEPEPELCPMKCGDITSDLYGGPCENCWNYLVGIH